jgi:excisionase family DNA binding protein
MLSMKGYITSKEAAERLGVSKRRVLALITAGALPAKMFGTFYVIKESDLKLVENRKPGRPSKRKK